MRVLIRLLWFTDILTTEGAIQVALTPLGKALLLAVMVTQRAHCNTLLVGECTYIDRAHQAVPASSASSFASAATWGSLLTAPAQPDPVASRNYTA